MRPNVQHQLRVRRPMQHLLPRHVYRRFGRVSRIVLEQPRLRVDLLVLRAKDQELPTRQAVRLLLRLQRGLRPDGIVPVLRRWLVQHEPRQHQVQEGHCGRGR